MDNNSFDLMAATWDENPVRLNMTFHHILDGNNLLKKIHDALAPGGVLALADLDMEDGTFHGDMPGVYHPGFARGALVTALERTRFRHCSIEDAHVVERRDDREEIRCYPMFLATGRKVCTEKYNPGGRL